MNIKNIITKIFSLTLIFGVIFFATSSVSADCLENMSTWSNLPAPSNVESSGSCRSYTTDWDQRYNNQQEFDSDWKIFLKMFNFNEPSCNSSNVVTIQTKMQELW
jgi:hypothetical protein